MRMSDWSSDVCSSDLDYEAFVERVIDAVERIAVPTSDAIDGWAVGGGLALATACDFRVCSNTSRFGAPIAKTLSNTLSSKNLARLTAAFGVPRVKKMLLLADYVSADDALSRSDEQTSELQSPMRISYDVFCLKTKKK